MNKLSADIILDGVHPVLEDLSKETAVSQSFVSVWPSDDLALFMLALQVLTRES